MLRAGIVGLPNVGKSTLFNALVRQIQAQAANFPFCTIEPNVGAVAVPDPRLQPLADLSRSQSLVPTRLEVVDIAGLVAGASQGEGLGNQFLSNIRQVDAVVHLVRCFLDDDVVHVSGSVDPRRDVEVINLELALADAAQIDKRRQRLQRQRHTSPDAQKEDDVLERLAQALDSGVAARTVVPLSPEEERLIQPLGLLTRKPVIYAANVAEHHLADGNAMARSIAELAYKEDAATLRVSAQVEAELVELEAEERQDYLSSLGVQEGGLESLIQATYRLLGLRTYFTTGPKETRAWTIRAGMKAPQAAGVIHTDFERGFIRAQTIGWRQLLEAGSMLEARSRGWLRSEGRDYVVDEGDVMEFLFNV